MIRDHIELFREPSLIRLEMEGIAFDRMGLDQ